MVNPSSEQYDDHDRDLHFDSGSAQGGGSNVGYTHFYGGSKSDDEVQNKQREAQRLREELQRAEQEAEQLAILKQKEDRVRSGRAGSIDHLKKSTQKIDKEMERLQTTYEELNAAREIFQTHLADLNAISPDSWESNHLEDRLNDAIASIEEAEAVHSKTMRRVYQLMGEKAEAKKVFTKEDSESSEFAANMRLGFAFTLPLIIALVILLFVIKILF